MDISDDGLVIPEDLLILVDFVNRNGVELPDELPESVIYVDVDGNGFVVPLDVLLLMTYLNTYVFGASEGESTAFASAVPAPQTDSFFYELGTADSESVRAPDVQKPDELVLPYWAADSDRQLRNASYAGFFSAPSADDSPLLLGETDRRPTLSLLGLTMKPTPTANHP